MLKIYNTLEDVPEADRQHYVKSDGKYVPQLSDDHPVLVHNKQLLSEKATATARVKELEADAAVASEKSIPRGHVAIAKADADLLGKYKEHGTPDEVAVKVTEHDTMKADLDKRQRDDSLRQASKALGFNGEAFIRLPNLPEFISKPGKDGKTVEWFAQLKDDKGVITEKPAKEFVESSADITPFLPSLKAATKQVELHGSQLSTEPSSGDPFEWARNFGKNWNESRPSTDVKAAFGIGNAAS
jgi:hypothetical protein